MGESSAKNIPYGIHEMEGGIHLFYIDSIWKIPGSVKTSLKVKLSIAYTSSHYSKQPLVGVQLTGLMCTPKFKYMMYIRVETEE